MRSAEVGRLKRCRSGGCIQIVGIMHIFPDGHVKPAGWPNLVISVANVVAVSRALEVGLFLKGSFDELAFQLQPCTERCSE